jgi:secreted trypsin-like serine protease
MLNNLFVILTALMALRAEDTKVDQDIEVAEDEREGRIINGREARPFSYPFIVSLQGNGRHFCGGSLLDSTTVLTAAHCTDIVPTNQITVNVRRHDLRLQSSQEGGQTIRITRQTRHPQYNPQTILNDVAVWKLASPVSVQASYVTLDNGQFASQVNLPAETIGWGRINPNNNLSAPRLQHTVLPIYDHQQCSRGYGNSLSPQAHVCAGYAEGISASCEGDSGGPLFVNQGGRAIQIGITSFGRNKQCLNPGIPTVSILLTY